MRVPTFIAMLALSSISVGCGCGDTIAERKLVISELSGYSADSARFKSFQVDTSAMPAGSVERQESAGACGSPITELKLRPKGGVKIIIVPADEP